MDERLQPLFGYPELVTDAAWRESRIHPEDRDRVGASLQRAAIAKRGAVASDEYRFRRSDGSYATVTERAYVIHDDAGPRGVLGAIAPASTAREPEPRALPATPPTRSPPSEADKRGKAGQGGMTLLARRILVALAVLAVALVAYLAYPFASALLVAAVLAAALAPAYERVAVRLKGRRTLAAALVTTAVALLLALPVLGLTLTFAQQSVEAVSKIRTTLQKEGVAGVVDDLPAPLRDAARQVIARLPRREKQVEELVGDQTGRMAGAVGYVLLATWSLLFQTAMMLVAFSFLLLDGPTLVRWGTEVGPLKHAQMGELLSDFRDVSVAVLVSSVVAAGIDALVACAAYLVTRVPQALIFTVVTFVAAFLPVVGASAVVLSAAAFMFVTDHSGAALFLAGWVVVVSVVDHLVKPYLMKGRIQVHGGVVFFSLLGGVAMLGPAGLLAGPLIVAFFLAVVRMCQKEFHAV